MTAESLIGWHNMTEADYHKDPCPEPSLSASTAKALIYGSPLHAWTQHPKNPAAEPWTPSNLMNIGKAVHAAVFGGAKLAIIDADSFRTKAAKEERDDALSDGLIPILEKDVEVINAMADICRHRFERLYGGPQYHAERVAIWRCPRTGGWRRSMLDTSALEAPIIVDLKTTGGSVDDETVIKKIFADGHHIQAAAYEEAMETLEPDWEGRVQFYFQFQEQNIPYAMSRPFHIGEMGMTLGREQWRAAGAIWDACVSQFDSIKADPEFDEKDPEAFAQAFPAYGIKPQEANPPVWIMSQWEMQKGVNELYQGVV